MPLLRRIVRAPLSRIAICIGFCLLGSVLPWLLPRALRTHLLQQFVMALFAVLGLLFVTTVVERRRPAAAGLGLKGLLPHTLGGLGLGIGMISAVIALLAIPGWYRVAAVNGAGFLPKAVLSMLLVAVFEEVLLRGAIFRILSEWLGPWWALGISAALFGAAHLANPGATVMAALAIAVEAGVMLAAAFMLTRSLWLAIGIHWGWNLAEGAIFGTAVSGGLSQESLLRAVVSGPGVWTGGAFGPEAGLAALLLGGGAGAILLWLAVHRRRAEESGSFQRMYVR